MAGQAFTNLKEKLPTNWQELDEVFKELDITPRRIIAGILSVADKAEKDRDKLKAWDMLSKLTGRKPPERVFVTGYDGLKLMFEGNDSA